MIDPKFNELPDDGPKVATGVTPEGARAPGATQPRKGLSINETIAGDSLLSDGSRGVDTSGVRTGSGAGAGGTSLTTAGSTSPAPSIEASSRGTSTGQGSIGHSDTGLPGTGFTEIEAPKEDAYSPSHEEISARAYQNWTERGCPVGSAEADWELAYQQLRAERSSNLRTVGASA